MATVGEGIASGITNAISFGLQDKALGIRQDRADALNQIGTNRNEILQGNLDLRRDINANTFRPSVSQQQESFETKQATDKLSHQKAIEDAEKRKPSLDAAGYLNKTVGDAHTPEQERLLQQLIDTRLFQEKSNGLVSESSINDLLKSGFDIKDPDTSVTEWMIDFQNAGAKQAENQAEVREQELEKAVKKNPLLATNPEALQADPDASELTKSITELRAMSLEFKKMGAEADQIRKFKGQVAEERKREEAQNRVNLIRAFQTQNAKTEKRDIKITPDSLGNLGRFDKQTGERLPLDTEVSGQQASSPQNTVNQSGEELIANISRDRKNVLVTPSQVKTGAGLASNIRQGFNNTFGMFVPGQIAPETEQAKDAIRSFNQMVKNDLTINSRNPVAELRTIQGFLPDPDRAFQDPDANITKMINLVKRFEGDVIKFKNILDSGNVSKEQRIDLTNSINSRLGILSQVPTIVELKVEGGRGIDVSDVERMTIEEIQEFPADSVTEEIADVMIKRLQKKK